LAVFFNPTNSKAKQPNFLRFYASLQEFHDALLVIELTFGTQTSELRQYCQNIVVLSSNTILWHKEALINFGFRILARTGFKFLGWLDGDLVFDNPSWFTQTLALLRRKALCQLFSDARRAWADTRTVASRRITLGIVRSKLVA